MNWQQLENIENTPVNLNPHPLARQIETVLAHWKNQTLGTIEDTNRVLDYLESVISNPADADSLTFAYFADTSKGEELLEKYGTGITHDDLTKEVQQSIAVVQ